MEREPGEAENHRGDIRSDPEQRREERKIRWLSLRPDSSPREGLARLSLVSSVIHPCIGVPPFLFHIPRTPLLLPGILFQVKSQPSLCLMCSHFRNISQEWPCLNNPGALSHWLGAARGKHRSLQMWLWVSEGSGWDPPSVHSLKSESWTVCSHGHCCTHTVKITKAINTWLKF